MPKPNKSKLANKATQSAEPKDDSFAPNIVIKSAPNSRKAKRPLTPPVVPEPALEPEAKPLFTEAEMVAYRKRLWENYYRPPTAAERTERLAAEWDDPIVWEERLEILERLRWKYNQKAAWSADVILAVNKLDGEIEECYENLERIEYY